MTPPGRQPAPRRGGGLSPYQLPRVRRDLVRATRGAAGFTDDDVTRDVNRLLAAELYWVTRDMTRTAMDASADLPEWTATLAAPSRFGLLIWDDQLPSLPWTGAPERGFTTSPLGARVPPQAPVCGVAWWPEPGGITLAPLAPSAALGDLLVPRWAAAAVFPFGNVRLDDRPIGDLHGDGSGLVALTGATWLLMQQPTVGATRPLHEPVTGQSGGHAARPDREVTIIDLRRLHEPTPDRDPTDGPSRVYTHRWLVRGHWRQQAVGPGRALRRPTWVPPHTKGPDGAPLIETEHVHVWRR